MSLLKRNCKESVVIFTLFGLIAAPTLVSAQLAVEFEAGAPPDQLFGETNFLPGDTVVRWAKLTNETAESLPVGMAVIDFSDSDNLASQIDFVVSQNAGQLFSGTLAQFAALDEFSLDNALAPNSSSQFDFLATFNPDAGNEYQLAEVTFNLVFGIIGDAPVDQGGPAGGLGIQSVSSGGGSSSGITGSISGVLFNDINGSGVLDAQETGLGGWIVYLDTNSNNLLDGGELDTQTSPDGTYGFFNLAAGTYTVRTVLQNGWSFVVPSEAAEFEHVVGVVNGALTGFNFGVILGQVAGISDTVSFDDNGNLTNEQGEVLQAVDSLPKTGMGTRELLLLFTYFTVGTIVVVSFVYRQRNAYR